MVANMRKGRGIDTYRTVTPVVDIIDVPPVDRVLEIAGKHIR